MKPNGIIAPPAGIDGEAETSQRAVIIARNATARRSTFFEHLRDVERLNSLIFTYKLLIIPDEGALHKGDIAKRCQTE